MKLDTWMDEIRLLCESRPSSSHTCTQTAGNEISCARVQDYHMIEQQQQSMKMPAIFYEICR